MLAGRTPTSHNPPSFSRFRFNLTLILCTLVVLSTIGGWWVEHQLSGPLIELARVRATNIATTAINGAIRDVLSGSLQDLELVQYSGKGSEIQSIRYNMGPLNQVMSSAVQSILEAFKSHAPEEFQVPFGELTGLQVFSAWGPPIPIRILTTGSVVADPKVDFHSAGINQVAHRIYLDVNVKMIVVAPFVKEAVVVRQPVIITEDILPGKVPDTYVNLVGFSGSLNEAALLLDSIGSAKKDGTEGGDPKFRLDTRQGK